MKKPFFLLILISLACGSSQELMNAQATISAVETSVADATVLAAVTVAASPTETIQLAPTIAPTPTNANEQIAVVVKIVDGDTIDVQYNNKVFRVRYIGIDTPERNEDCFSQATQANSEMVLNKTVRLVKDVSETDRFDRLLRYVYVEDTFINGELVALGYAEAVEYPPDTAQADLLESLETQAKGTNIGCYSLGMFGGVSAAPTSTFTAQVINTATRVPATQAPLPTATQAVVPVDTDIVIATQAPAPTQAPLPTEPPPTIAAPPAENCDRNSYPDVCIPPHPPDLDCGQISFRRFRVLQPDPHGFDGDNDGVGCESG